MQYAGLVFFSVCVIVSVAGALATILSRNPIRSAFGLLLTILGIAGLFLKLNAQFLAAIQLIVYAGAVVVLFVFVIMLLGPDASNAPPSTLRSTMARLGGGLAFAVVGITLLALLIPNLGGPAPEPVEGAEQAVDAPLHFGPAPADHGTVEAVGGLLYTKGIVPFEISTALLIVAVVGAIAVARGPALRRKKPKQVLANPTLRLFSGPLDPRDAEHPIPTRRGRPGVKEVA